MSSELALVLGGGGAKGAYEIGVIRALGEMGIYAGRVFGTSVGSLNAALYAQGSLDLAEEMWKNLKVRDVIAEKSIQAIADDLENIFDHPEKLLDFIARYAHHKGLDITPLNRLLDRIVNERAIRESPVRLGLVTTRFPTLAMVEKTIDEMAPDTLRQWLVASSACFPFFPMQQIDGERYIDGGFCDNTPVEMAIRSGAHQIIAVDIGKHRSHVQYDRRPNIRYIRASRPLGGLLDFDPVRSERNIRLGRLDALRAYGRLCGQRFFFQSADPALKARAEDFVFRLTQYEASLTGGHALTRRNDPSPFFSLLENGMPEQPTAADYLLRACELCGEIAELDDLTLYTFESFRDALIKALPLEKSAGMLDSLLGGRIGILFAGKMPDRKLVISCLYSLLKKENSFSPLALRTLSSFPKEMLCAWTLQEILGD